MQATTVVEDSADLVRLLVWPGSECQIPDALARNGHREPEPGWRWNEAVAGQWKLTPWRWFGTRVLMFLRPGDPYAVYLWWADQTDDFLLWYVNFQRPFVRSETGFDTHDLDLDLVVPTDGEPQWKDEDAYADGVARGGISREEAEMIEAARAGVLERVRKKEGPFADHWKTWKPDPPWQAPDLPPGWDVID